MTNSRLGRLGGSAGYTVVEALTVVAAMGAVGALTAPSMLRFQAIQDVQAASSQVGGMLQKARARAIGEATPQLVLFQEEDVDGSGERTTFALLVRDNDRSYSVTPPDEVEAFALDARVPSQVRQLGVAPDSRYADISAAPNDGAALRAVDAEIDSSGSGSSGSGSSGSGSSDDGGLLGGVGRLVDGLLGGSSSGSGSSGSGSSGSGSSGTSSAAIAADTEVGINNGATFPVSETDGVPLIAFNERGIPVSADSPKDWGSGAGAVYLTDNEHAVVAVVVTPLGAVEMARYDNATSTWK